MLVSSLLRNYKSLLITAVFLLLYYGVPPILANLINPPATYTFFALINFLPPLIMIGIIHLLYGKNLVKWRNFLHLPYWEIIKTSFKWILMALGCNMIWVVILSVAGLTYQAPAIEEILNSGDYFVSSCIAILAVIIAPIAEELTFREAIYHGLRDSNSEKTAMIITSLLFALAHNELWQIPGLFVLGYLFQKNRNHYGNIESAIIAHAFNNFLAILLFFSMQVII